MKICGSQFEFICRNGANSFAKLYICSMHTKGVTSLNFFNLYFSVFLLKSVLGVYSEYLNISRTVVSEIIFWLLLVACASFFFI